MSAALEVRALVVRFGGVTAVDGLSFAVERGTLVGLMGPNGAGKTTVLRAVTGALRPDAGQVLLDGRALGRLPVHRRARLGLGLSHQIVRPFRAMSVRDNVALAAGHRHTRGPLAALLALGRAAARARAEAVLERVGIGEAADARPGELPLGYLKRLEVARALALDPSVLLLDEPLAGLGQAEARRLADTIAGLCGEGRSVVLIEHNLGELLRVAGRLVAIDGGRLLAEGAPDEVMAHPAVRAAYLGVSDAAA